MRSLLPYIVRLGFGGALLVAACQAPDEYFWGPDAGIGGPGVAGRGGPVTGTGGSPPGTGGLPPTGLGGTTAGVAGSIGTAGTTGSGGSSGGTTGSAGTTGAAGSAAGRGGTTGNAGTTGSAGRGGTTGNAGTTGSAGRGGTTGNAGTTGSAGRGGTTGNAGTTGSAGRGGTTGTAGRGGTTGNAGTTGTAGGTGTVLFSEDFENETVDAADPAAPSGWSRSGGSSSDWHIANDGTKVLQQDVKLSTTVGIFAATGASGWSGAVSASARVKMIEAGSSNQVALLCVRYNDNSNRYCGALVPGGVQILTVVGGTAGGSNVFSVSGVTTGTFYDLRISVDTSNVLTVFLNGTQRGTYTPTSMTSGTVAVGTASMTAAFDNVTVTRP